MQPCLCHNLVKAQNVEGMPDDLAAYSAGSLLEAGSDTTANTLMGFVQAMVLFQNVQRDAQTVLDRVCGDRMPTIDDDLQYVRACVKETLRWFPTDVLGIPHAVIQDDIYNGFKIPKDAAVIWNVW
jgi:cytochrome P450